MNEILKNMKERRSIRTFSKEEIDDHQIKQILYAATLSPSAHNKQPWEFIVIKNVVLKEKLASLLIEDDLNKGKKTSSSYTASIIKEAPILILIYNKYDDFPLFNTLSLGAAIQNMLLYAHSEHIGSLWIGNLVKVEKEIEEILHKNMRLVSAVALGFSKETGVMPDRNLVDAITEWRE